jgi:hypothetical protein
MSHRCVGLLLLLAISMCAAKTGHTQSLFLPGTPEVDQLAAIYQEAGRVFPTTSFPVSKAELSRFAASLASTANGGLATDLRAYQDKVLAFDPTRDSVSASGSAGFEYTYRTQNASFDPGLPTEFQILDLQRLFLRRLPLAAAVLDFWRDSGFELGISGRVEREYFLDPFNVTNLWENNPSVGDPVALENQDIMRGFLWYDFHPLQVDFGRDKIHMGPGRHSLLPSVNLPFLDVLRLRLPIGRLTGDLVISTLENRKIGPDVPDPNLPGNPLFGSSIILMAIHRYEYAFDTVRLGIAAMCVYARDGNAFSLGDIFPVFSWHQADIGPNNTILVADATWAPLPGLTVSAQFGLDDVNLSAAGISDGSVPTIPAAIITADYLLHLPQTLSLGITCEIGSTHYLWGNFALDSTLNTDTLARAIDRYRMDGGNVLLPLTSPYGPGATWAELSAALHGIPWLDASISARYFSRMTDPANGGEPVNLVNTAYAQSSAIGGAPHIDTWSVAAEARLLPVTFLALSIGPAFYLQVDNRTGIRATWMELSLGVSVHGESVTTITHEN